MIFGADVAVILFLFPALFAYFEWVCLRIRSTLNTEDM